MVVLVIVVIVLIASEALVWRYGADSRDGNDWKIQRAVGHSPQTG